MPITIECSSCKATLRIRDELAGRKVKCPKCNSIIEASVAPPPDSEESTQDLSAPPSGAHKGVKTGHPPSKRQSKDQDDTEFDEPRRPRAAIDDADEDNEEVDERPRKKKMKKSRADLQAIATYQKAVLVCILVYIIAVVAQFALPANLRLFLGIAALGVSLAAAVFVFLLATKVYSTGLGIVLAILTLLPCIGLITLLIINSKATSTLNRNGVHVGFLGAKLSDLD
jgi:predicted Zn finger-like uncharacterized protein